MTITNLIIFCLISMIIVAAIPAIVEVSKEIKQWKNAYDKQERIAKFMKEFDNSMNNIENCNNDIDDCMRGHILYD